MSVGDQKFARGVEVDAASDAADVDAALDILGRLVAAPSPNPPGDERRIVSAIESEIARLRLGRPVVLAREGQRPNLILTLGDGAPELLLVAHTDTVPASDVEEWFSNPYSLELRDGRYYGLGSCDMKAAIALMLVAAKSWRERWVAGTLKLAFVADEEGGSAYGAEWLAREGLLAADAAIVLEPASIGEKSWEKLYLSHRGSCVLWVTATGTPGHSAAPVPSATRAPTALVRALYTLGRVDLFPDLVDQIDGTRPAVNVGTVIETGEIPWAYAPTGRAAIEVRTIEGMAAVDVVDAVTRVLGEAGLEQQVQVTPAGQAYWHEPSHPVQSGPLLDAASAAWCAALNAQPEYGIYPAGTDAQHLSALGIPVLPAFGPGSLAAAHQPNEAISRSDMCIGIQLLDLTLRHYFKLAAGEHSESERGRS